MPANHANLRTVADRILNNRLANVIWVGDSTGSAVNSPRWAQGIRRRWDVKWIGKYVPSDSDAPEEVGQVFSAGEWSTALVDAGATLGDGVSVNPFCHFMSDGEFTGDMPAFNAFIRHVLTNMQSHGEDIPGGPSYPSNWIHGNNAVAKFIVIVPDTPATNALEYVAYVCSTNSVEGDGGGAIQLNLQPAGLYTQTRTVKQDLSTRDEYEAHTKVFWGVDETGKFYYQAGVLFKISDATVGFQFAEMSVGGWSASDHCSSLNAGGDAAFYDADGKYTQAQLVAYLQQLGAGASDAKPNIAFVQIGINRSVGENGGSESHLLAHKAYVEKIATRYRAAMLAAGATDPWVVLVTHWQVADNTSDNITWANGKNAKYQELVDAYPDWLAMADVNAVLIAEDGAWPTWSGTYLSDTIHQTEAGVVRFAEILWGLMEDALGSNSFRGRGLIGGVLRNRSIARL